MEKKTWSFNTRHVVSRKKRKQRRKPYRITYWKEDLTMFQIRLNTH